MFLILHHGQVFHKSLIFYEIHYKNMRNVHFLKTGIRRKLIISTDYIILKNCFPSVLSVCQYRTVILSVAALYFIFFSNSEYYIVTQEVSYICHCWEMSQGCLHWPGLPECPCPAPAVEMLPGKGQHHNPAQWWGTVGQLSLLPWGQGLGRKLKEEAVEWSGMRHEI